MWGLVAVAGLELAYLAVFNIWIPARLVAFAKRHELSLRLTGFRSLYPGDLRVAAMQLSGASQAFDITTEAVQGRMKLWALIGGSFDLASLQVANVRAHVKRPGELLLARARGSAAPTRVEAQEAGFGDLPGMQQIRVDRAKISVASAGLGALKLDGQVEVQVTRARLAEGGLEMQAFAHFLNVKATRASRDDAPLAALDGDVAWQITEREGARRRADGSRLSVRSSMRWRTANLGALLGTGPDIDARDAHLSVELRMNDGATRPGSYVELQSAELRAPDLPVLLGAGVFRQARLRLDLEAPKASPDHLTGSLSLHSADVEFAFHGQAQHFSIAGKTTIDDLDTSASSLRLSGGQFHAERASSRGVQAEAQQALHLVLKLDRAHWSSHSGLGLSGELLANGSDASALLALGPPDPGARWMLSELVLTPFNLRLDVRLRPELVSLQNIVLRTPRDDARGALYLGDAGARGVLLFQRGKLNIGVEVQPDTLNLNLGVDGAWLTRSLAALSAARAPDVNGP
ncbi:MAG: hypothetical protein ABI548_27350 [Polyangiaceae bacterium]